MSLGIMGSDFEKESFRYLRFSVSITFCVCCCFYAHYNWHLLPGVIRNLEFCEPLGL